MEWCGHSCEMTLGCRHSKTIPRVSLRPCKLTTAEALYGVCRYKLSLQAKSPTVLSCVDRKLAQGWEGS